MNLSPTITGMPDPTTLNSIWGDPSSWYLDVSDFSDRSFTELLKPQDDFGLSPANDAKLFWSFQAGIASHRLTSAQNIATQAIEQTSSTKSFVEGHLLELVILGAASVIGDFLFDAPSEIANVAFAGNMFAKSGYFLAAGRALSQATLSVLPFLIGTTVLGTQLCFADLITHDSIQWIMTVLSLSNYTTDHEWAVSFFSFFPSLLVSVTLLHIWDRMKDSISNL